MAENERLRAQLEAGNSYLRDEVKTIFNADEVAGSVGGLRARPRPYNPGNEAVNRKLAHRRIH